jgi:hypothetical protein
LPGEGPEVCGALCVIKKKEKALAEAATLLMLAKKCELLWPHKEESQL